MRQNIEKYTKRVMRRSTLLFKMSPVDSDSEEWEEVVNFTKIKKREVDIKNILSPI